ncbi:MAG: glycine/betaine ABC transporter substrate-binding protein [Clostridiales Family XIII bacterium]|jgi:osmoprotectant transport system substrate-binding protein|nr:glycine/betaine ABC transporter substrate-binding protein [Clostridiales Family XIII bacterium]
MKKMKMLGMLRTSLLLLLLSALAFLAPGCGSKSENVIKLGGKGFTEAFLMSELYALALEDAGYKVERIFGVPTLHEAILAGEVDVYPEYTGTGLINVLQEPALTDPDAVYDRVKDRYKEDFDLVWLESSQLNDSTCIVTLKSVADSLGIKTLSDLNKVAPELTLADFQGWSEREDNLIAMNRLYGDFDFKEIIQIDAGLKYAALESGEVQVIPGLTTEPQLLDPKFTVVEEDIKVWPPYYLAPVIRQDALDGNPGIDEILNKVSKAVDNEVIISLISKVDIDGGDYEDVAKEFYETSIR